MRIFFFVAISLSYFISCDAPRINPFDPNAENYQGDNPSLAETKFYSTFENFNSRTTLTFQTKINDRDNNIDVSNVTLLLESSNFSKDLDVSMNGAMAEYKLDIRLQEIDSLLNPENIVEKDFSIKIITDNDDNFVYSPFNIRRVIMEELATNSPSDGSVESGEILFAWQPVALDYDFNYRIELFSLQRLELIAEISDIHPDSSQYLLQDSEILDNLDFEDNIWSLYVIDSLGNRNKSHFNLFNYSK